MDPKDIRQDEDEFQQVEQQIQDDNPEDELKINQGAWTLQQNKKYVFFMTYFKDIFVSKERRKSFKIFKFLSGFLQTRSARQCRSHFQKLINKHKTIHKLKNYFKGLVGKESYEEQYKLFANMMDANHPLSKIKKKQDIEGIKELNQMGVQTEGVVQSYMQQQNWGSQNSIEDYPQQSMAGLYGFLIIPTTQQYTPNTQKQQ